MIASDKGLAAPPNWSYHSVRLYCEQNMVELLWHLLWSSSKISLCSLSVGFSRSHSSIIKRPAWHIFQLLCYNYVSPFKWDNNTNKLKFCRMSSGFGKTLNRRYTLNNNHLLYSIVDRLPGHVRFWDMISSFMFFRYGFYVGINRIFYSTKIYFLGVCSLGAQKIMWEVKPPYFFISFYLENEYG